MKKLILITVAALFTNFTFAQWSGATNTTGDINRTGSVAIGTNNSPETKLDVRGSTSIGTNTERFIIAGNSSNEEVYMTPRHTSNNSWAWNNKFGFNTNDSHETWFFQHKLSIGTKEVTDAKLTVNGKILCEEVEVIQDVTPDYVFQKYYTGFSELKNDYIMPTLEEVEAFTKKNHHLPEVPSAAEIKENGMQLKDMTTMLLQKVEELTLYTIEQEKRIKALEAELKK